MTPVVDFKAAASALLDRFRFARQAGLSFNGARDTYQILGYPQIITYSQYRARYRRDGIAKRIVEAYPKATWRGGVELYEDEDPNTDTSFEQAWKTVEHTFNVWARLQAVDILAGLSTFAVLLIGAEGDLATPLPKGSKLLYLQPYSGGGGPTRNDQTRSSIAFDADCSIRDYDTDTSSPRFGEPLTYQLKRTDFTSPDLNRPIHHTRIIHVAEGCLDDNVYGQPTLENVWNLLDDLTKVTGGGAEAHWLRANQGLVLDIDKTMGLPGGGPEITADQQKRMYEQAEEMQHQLQRVMLTRGVTATQLGSDVANFGPNADAILKQIAGSKGIPQRILTGSEMGQLASGQDADNWNTAVQDRRTTYAGPMIVRRLVDRLIEFGYLPTPSHYEVGWPVEEDLNEGEKADFAVKLATVNKTQGSIVFADDEIREMAFDREPLSPEQKVPLTAPERVTATAPNPEPALVTAEDAELLRVLEAAIKSGNADVVHRIIGLGDFKYGSTQVQLPSDVAARLFKIGAAIDDADVYEPEGGRETDAHVTVKYGLLDPNVVKLSDVVSKLGSVTFTLGLTSFFSTPDYDVVYVEVKSPDLADLNASIAIGMECAPSDYGAYVPHATVAYVKPGVGAKYVGNDTLAGTTVTVNRIVMSDADGKLTEVSLA